MYHLLNYMQLFFKSLQNMHYLHSLVVTLNQFTWILKPKLWGPEKRYLLSTEKLAIERVGL